MSHDSEDKLLHAIRQAEDEEVAAVAEEKNPAADAALASQVLARLGLQPPPPWYRQPGMKTLGRGIAISALCILAVGVFLRFKPPIPDEQPLAVYQLEIPSDDRLLGTPTADQPISRLSRSSTLDLTVRPDQDQPGDLAARAFLVRNGEVRRWAVELERTRQGTFQLSSPVSALPELSPGRIEVFVAVGYSARLPNDSEIQRQIQQTAAPTPRGWRLLHRALEIIER